MQGMVIICIWTIFQLKITKITILQSEIWHHGHNIILYYILTQTHHWLSSHYTAKFNRNIFLTFNDASTCYVSWPPYTAYSCIILDRCNTSTQQKAIHLLSSHKLLTVGNVITKYGAKFAMDPHQNTRTRDDAMTTLE